MPHRYLILVPLLLWALAGCDSAEPEPPADLLPSEWRGAIGLDIDRSVYLAEQDSTFNWNEEFIQSYRLEFSEPLSGEPYDYKGTLRISDSGLAHDVPAVDDDGMLQVIDIRIDRTETYVARATWESGSPYPSLVLEVGELAVPGSALPSTPPVSLPVLRTPRRHPPRRYPHR